MTKTINKKSKVKKIGAIFQIALMISMSFALAFILSDNFASALPTPFDLSTLPEGWWDKPPQTISPLLTGSGSSNNIPSIYNTGVYPGNGFSPESQVFSQPVLGTPTIDTSTGATQTQTAQSMANAESEFENKMNNLFPPNSPPVAGRDSVAASFDNAGWGTIKDGKFVEQYNGDYIVGKDNAIYKWDGKDFNTKIGNLGSDGSTVSLDNPFASEFKQYEGPFGIAKGVTNPLANHLVKGLFWSVAVVGAIQMIGGLAGLDSDTTKALSLAAFGGIMAGQAVTGALQSGYLKFLVNDNQKILGMFKTSGGAGLAIGAAVAIAIFIALYSKEKKKVVNFQCLPFEPKLGGAQCEQCNNNPFKPCTEYRCKSLGQACELLNANTAKAQCAWVSRNDVKSPEIKPWNDALYPTTLQYKPDTAIRPPSIGTKIVKDDGCIDAYTPLRFGIATNEPAQCKIDYNHTAKFDDMQYYFGDTNYFSYNHTQKMRLPGPNNGNESIAPELKNDGNFGLYVRCRDANGNENVDEYVFSFCVNKEPDTTPPVIEDFSIPSGSYVTYNKDNVPIEVYLNEPAECKWSIESKAYEDMENNMQCFTESYQVNGDLQYTCAGNLTGVKNREDNTFYFRCKDQPDNIKDNERNKNMQSTALVLKGSQPLDIYKVMPNGTITGSTETVKVDLELETQFGAESGKATCYFSDTGTRDSYITMFETDNYMHKQTLSLTNGLYKYYFRCIDSGGNAVENYTNFTVYVDKQAPIVTRVYKQEALKVVTDEDAECSYSLTSCAFEFKDGIKMEYSNIDIKYNLFAEWKIGNTYYIKCRDLYGNEPNPNQCSIYVSAIELSKKV